MSQLVTSFEIGKLPVHFSTFGIAFIFQSGYLPLQSLHISDPAPQTITLKYAQFDFGHFKPTGVFRRVSKAQLSSDAAGLLWGKGLIQRSQAVGVQIVLDQFEPLCFRIAFIYQPFENVGIITSGPPFGDAQVAETSQWFKDDEKIGCTTPFVLIIDTGYLTGLGRLALAYFGQQLFSFFIQADYRMIRIENV
jgi:hypothetical protein